MASPRRSSAPQVEYGAAKAQRHRMRLVESSSEDDDDEDEHKLQIDLSSPEDDTSSLESHDHNGVVVPTTTGDSLLASSESHSDHPSDVDPLQSLRMLVRSPFAQGQISPAADASHAKGCESISAANATTSSNSSILSSQQLSSSSNAQSSCAISLTPVPRPFSPVSALRKLVTPSSGVNLTPEPTPFSPLSAAAGELSAASSAASSSPFYAIGAFQKLTSRSSSTASVDPASKAQTNDHGAVEEDEEEEEEEEEEEGEEEGEIDEEDVDVDVDVDEDDDGANRVSDATIQRVLKKLNAAAIDEINLRTLQELPSEEAFSFNRFRKMLSNHSQFDAALPNLSSMVGAGGAFPPRPTLTTLMRQELQSQGDPFAFPALRNPPALTVISKLDMPMAPSSRPGRRRSPPPMVPISRFRGSVANNGAVANSGVHDGFDAHSFGGVGDGVLDRLKRLGTDVAVEPRSPPQFSLEDYDNDEYDDDEELPFVPPECILATEPVVTKVTSLPSLMPIPGDHGKSVTLSRIQPPPPSLIPIHHAPPQWPTTARFVPILPRQSPPAWNVNVNQTPAACGPANAFSRPGFSTNSNSSFSFTSVNSAIKKPKRQKLSNKSHYSKLANSLVLPANASKRMDPVLVAESVLARAMKPQSSARLGELEIIKVGPPFAADEPKAAFRPLTPPHWTFSGSSTSFAPLPDFAVKVVAPTAPVIPPPPPSVVTPPSTFASAASAVASGTRSNFFEFSLKKFANSTVLTKSQRKLYGCCICSTVYHKMFSLKKHFFRTHVNPLCVSRQDALKYDVLLPQNAPGSGNVPQSEWYKCDTCGVLFGDHEQLRLHIGEHQPSNYEHANRYRCTGCNFVFRKEKVFTRHLLECAATGASATSAVFNAARFIETVPAKSVDATAMKEVASVSVAQSVVPSNDPMDNVGETGVTSTACVSTTVESLDIDTQDKTDEAIAASGSANMMCLFCEVTFKDNTERQKHVLQNHHPKRKQQTCAYCKKKDINDLRELLQHICEVHNKKYFGCAKCKIRFKTKDELTAHRQESHASNGTGTEKTAALAAVGKPKPGASVKTKNGRTFRCSKCLKICKGMTELLSHRKTAHKPPKVKIKQHYAFDKFGDSLVTRAKHPTCSADDVETEFYKKISLNVKTNLEYYLDGKLDHKAQTESKCVTRSSQNNNLGSNSNDDSEFSSAPNGELGFVEMYGRENFNAAFLRNASRLHIGTQLTMLKKTNMLHQGGVSEVQQIAGGVSVPSKLSLTPQKLNAVSVSDEGTKDVAANSTKEIEFSGEWIRPRRYICKVCLARFNGFWEIEDHFWAKHPNVWHSFYEFPAEQDPGAEFLQTCKRFLSNAGVCGKADAKWSTSTPSSECTKCGLVLTPIAEFHKHILECGGDTNWMSTMYTPTKKHKKWRPYSGHRRRRTVMKNRMCFRNIPETPMKIPSQSKGKQKAGDTETIQKMIANLPPKRKTRRVVNFDDVNRSRFLARSSVLTRRRREQLDPKSNARVSKAFAGDNEDVMSIVRRNRRGSKSTFKVPSSTNSLELPPQSLPISSDSAVQPFVQVENIKIERDSEVISVDAVVHETRSSSVDYEKSTSEEQPDNKFKLPQIVGFDSVDVPIIEEAGQNSISESTSNISEEKFAWSFAGTSVVAPSLEYSKDASQIVPAVEVPIVDEVTDTSPMDKFRIGPPVDVPKTEISPAEIPTSTTSVISAEASAGAATFAFVDNSSEETPVTECAVAAITRELTVASEEKPAVASTADKKPAESALLIHDEELEPPKEEGSTRPTGRQSPALPDSSVILAAMADTFGQTDTEAPNVVYSSKLSRKRKRGSKQAKCKKCGSKSSKRQKLCVACAAQQQHHPKEAQLSPPPQKKRAVHDNFLQFVCECCGSEVFSTARDGKICDLCLKTSSSAVNENTAELPTEPSPSERICADCGCAFSSDLADIMICDKCASLKVCGTCGDKSQVLKDATVCLTCSLAAATASAAAAAPASPKAQAMVTTTSTMVRVTTPEQVTETKPTACRSCGEMYANVSSDLCTLCQPRTPKHSYLAQTSITPISSSKCRFDSHETVVTPKSTLETPSPPQLRLPSPTKLADDDRCIHCSEQTTDRNDSGSPACRMCHELWITLNTDNLEPVHSASGIDPECIECDVLRTNETTSQRYCEACAAKRNSLPAYGGAFSADNDLFIKRRRSSEVSVQVGESSGLPDSYLRATKMATPTAAVSGISTTSAVKSSEDPSKPSTSGSKNTLLLICKGCYGTYNTVSAYKEHRQQCPFRNSDDEASKKPLLGFAKRIKSGVEIVQVDSPGVGSFEVDGGVLQMHDDTISAAGVGNVSLKVEPSENTSGQSASSVDLDASAAKRFKPKIATDESIEETINSVVERFCSTSTPILENTNEIDSQTLADVAADLSDIANDGPAPVPPSPSPSTNEDDKTVAKRLRNKPVDSPTRTGNMKTVEGQVEKLLQSSAKNRRMAARRIFTFSDASFVADAPHPKEEPADETSPACPNEDETSRITAPTYEVVPMAPSSGKKKKLRGAKMKSGGKTRARQKMKASRSNSSAAVSAASAAPDAEEKCSSNTAIAAKESPRSECKKVSKKRRAEDDVLDQSSEVRLSFRLRRKSLLTDDVSASRVLRSKSKGDVAAESKEDVPLVPAKQDEDTGEPNARESASSDRRRHPSADKAKTKPVEADIAAAESHVGASTCSSEPEVKPPKTKGTKRKADAKDTTAGAAGLKRVRSSSHDLGFNVAKSGNKNVRSSQRLKDEDGKSVADDSNQPPELSSTEELQPSQTESAATPSNASERGNFLELRPSVPKSYLQVSSIGERPASAEGPKVRRTVAEEESMANELRDQSNDLEQPNHQKRRFVQSSAELTTCKDATEMQRIQQNLERSYSYVFSMLNAVCEVLGSPEASCDNPLDPSVANELEELKNYADVASEAVLLLKNPKLEDCIDFSHNFTSPMHDVKQPPKLYCELENQNRSFIIHKACNVNKAQINVNKPPVPVVNGNKTAAVKNGKFKSHKNQSNGVKRKLRCNHCQKVLPTKNEMAAHIQEHFRRFTISKKDNAAMLKMCIADGFEQLLKDKAIDTFLKFSNVSESGLCAPLKTLSETRYNQLEKWKLVVNQLVEIETKGSGDLSRCATSSAADPSACEDVKNVELLSSASDSKPVIAVKRSRNGELYQCPMCSTQYEYKQSRNRHLTMVHARHRSSQQFIFDLDSAKSARASFIADSVNNASSTSKKEAAVAARKVKCNGTLAVGVTASSTCSSTCSDTCANSPADTAATAEASATTVDCPAPPPLSPPTTPTSDPASLPPPLLPANVEMPALSRQAVDAHQSPPALTIASPITNSRPKTPPNFAAEAAAATPSTASAATPSTASAATIVTPPPAAPAKAVAAPAKPNGGAAGTGAATPGTTTPASTPALQPATVNGKRCRKKMSKKEMNIPAHVIKAKAEEALRELTGNRFYRL